MARKNKEKLALGSIITAGPGTGVQGGWKHPQAEHHRFLEIPYYVEIAQSMERGGFDFIFFADKLAIPGRNPESRELALRTGTWGAAHPDPLLIVAALAGATKHLGLAVTLSTSYQHPFTAARSLATLDHLSGGRAVWNVVTSHDDAEAHNYGLARQLQRSARYNRADEFVETVFGLWDTWEDDAVIFDKENNTVIDPAKVHELNHHGEHFHVQGPLNIPRPPQGRPVIAQAGSSEEGRDFAARWAEVIFTPQPNIDVAKAFYTDLKSRLPKFGRTASELKVLPGALIIVGENEAIAREKEALLLELNDARQALVQLSGMIEKDLSGYSLDEPAEPILSSIAVQGMQGHVNALAAIARKDSLTLGQLARRFASGLTFARFVGTPTQIADEIEKWFENYACDGFMLRTAYNPSGTEDIVRLLIPELRKRGLVRTEYTGKTLRENIGLARPERETWRQRLVTPEPIPAAATV
ncbi:MAG: hypothetical protein B9S32_01065 [Verrucomicrobia bacterium Tous-C9LFEB]|nr:MAG: hypothetical protein B9S32_01065 [Verrucomicrobia bacterium Tous-C9LFEB]